MISKDGQQKDADKKLKILVVEDDLINQMVIRKMLELRQVEVVCVPDGFEAIDVYKENDDFDLVIMDIQLPGMDGIETKQRISEIQKSSGKKVPVIALTAYAGEENIEYFLSSGFDDCAVKPVDYEHLFRLIKKHTFQAVG